MGEFALKFTSVTALEVGNSPFTLRTISACNKLIKEAAAQSQMSDLKMPLPDKTNLGTPAVLTKHQHVQT